MRDSEIFEKMNWLLQRLFLIQTVECLFQNIFEKFIVYLHHIDILN